ncbi:hypothetical protein [Paraburkholderia domus]|uniref:hypothetical protein n=1 Tax=Paraburkholderia domus TaxID=2793075 RepID=UPI001911DB7F|nr:hypothetical protein [Paraburkholderia domus]MBK5184266.1 hypothetical protein [Burkholderia sp. R-69749]
MACKLGEAVDYPRNTIAVWEDVKGLGELYGKVSSQAISSRVSYIYWAISYILLGYYDFALQVLKSSATDNTLPSFADLARGEMTVDPLPPWLDCWR